MSLYLSQKQRPTRSMSIFVMLLMLFVVSGHCSAAMAMAPSMPVIEEVASAYFGHHGDTSTSTDHYSDSDFSCCDDSSANTHAALHAQTFKQLKDKQDDTQPLVAAISVLPACRAGPCHYTPALHSPDFVTPPLYYSLCVLRL